MKPLEKCTLVIVTLLISLAFISCQIDRPGNHYHVPFINNSKDTIYILWMAKNDHYQSPHFHDTLLHSWDYNPLWSPEEYKSAPGEENTSAMSSDTPWEGIFHYQLDTLLIFVFNADALETFEWDFICENYLVEQRYDLSLEDLQSLDFKLYFPPTEAMKHIHMWPPYGTYDEHGGRKDKRN